ncbi:AraC family transcriptional regulator [Cellvibrio mixtus]|uniref:AraC family transcriptional regulator n=1 Tax=Cellvibrio mixtus TaxID=39650 RepID=UPI0005866522|nr:helix-turn-helix domain-containing protein [Cellvibrio mixtus]
MLASVDFFIRYACIGQLMLLAVLFLQYPIAKKLPIIERCIPVLLTICFAAFLLLTAPFVPRPQGIARHILLWLTDATPFFLWWCGQSLFDDNFKLRRWPRWSLIALSLLALWHTYYFLVLGGHGPYHDLNHVFGLVIMVHLIVSVINNWRDDLIEQRRTARAWLVSLLALYFVILSVVELSNTGLNRNQIFMLATSILCLIGSTVIGLMMLNHRIAFIQTSNHTLTHIPDTTSELQGLGVADSELYERLKIFIENRGYLQSNLVISHLAAQLNCPEHHLRKLINHRLGYTNFAAFLNHYRIEEACARLKNSPLPVLTIALDVGYGSIAPFNRAFKEITGETPTSYRNKIPVPDSN